MEINNFVSMDFLAGFTGTIIGVELIAYCTKELPIIKKIPTKIYIFLLTLIHIFVVKYAIGTFKLSLGNIYLVIINSFLVSTMLCSGYDIVIGNIQMPKTIKLQEDDIIKGEVPKESEEKINIGSKALEGKKGLGEKEKI